MASRVGRSAKIEPARLVSNDNRQVVVGGQMFVGHKTVGLDYFFVDVEKSTDLFAVDFVCFEFFLFLFFFVVALEVALAAAAAESFPGRLVAGLWLCFWLFFLVDF